MSDGAGEKFRGYPVVVRRFTFAGREFELLGPGNYESLIDDPRVIERFGEDEYLPYWAEFWPACLLLADLVSEWPAVGRQGSGFGVQDEKSQICGPMVLELGCGLGLPSLIATHLGYRVVCSDYDEDALAFVRESAARCGVPCPETRFIDWRKRYDDLRLDRIMAAEITYEARNLKPIAEFVVAHLEPGGEAILVDANRATADAFEAIAHESGLDVAIRPLERPGGPSDKPVGGRAFVLRRRDERLVSALRSARSC